MSWLERANELADVPYEKQAVEIAQALGSAYEEGLGKTAKHAQGLAELAAHLQAELDQHRSRAEAAEHKIAQIRTTIENYNEDEFLSADRALGAIHGLVTP